MNVGNTSGLRAPSPSVPVLVAALLTLLILPACSTTRELTDPRLDPSTAADRTLPVAVYDAEPPAIPEIEDDNSAYLDELLAQTGVLVDTLGLGLATADVPDISDSLAAATQARFAAQAELFDYPVVLNRRVLTWIDVYLGTRSFTNSLHRSGRYLPLARQIFAEEGIPQDLAFLGHVESGFRHNARSPARAVGLWQFMRGTAGDFGLRCDDQVDERLDPEKSTRACARYLKLLHDRYGDWLLALAAYNAGPGNVDRAIKKTGSRDFWEIAQRGELVNETRNFVPAILAATILAKSPEAHGFPGEAAPPLVYDTISVDLPTDLRVIARCAGASVEEIKELNPALVRGQTPRSRGYEVRVPAGTGKDCAARLAEVRPEDLVIVERHTVKRGDTLGGIAARYGTTVKALQAANSLGRSTNIKVGTTLRVPSKGGGPEAVADGVPPATAEASTHTVRRGETASTIARRHGVTVAELARANRLSNPSRLQVGQVLEIPGRDGGVASTAWVAPPSRPAEPKEPVVEFASVGPPRRTTPFEGITPDETAAILGRGESTADLVSQARAEVAADPEAVVHATSQGRTETLPPPQRVVDPATSVPGRVEGGAGSELPPMVAALTESAPAASGSSPSLPPDAVASAPASTTESSGVVADHAAASAPRVHRVQRGETLYGIARRYRVLLEDLRDWNGLTSASLIRAGQELRVSGPSGDPLIADAGVSPSARSERGGKDFRLHVVARGDTLWQIAHAHGVSVNDLLRWNGLRARSRIYPGQKIKIY